MTTMFNHKQHQPSKQSLVQPHLAPSSKSNIPIPSIHTKYLGGKPSHFAAIAGQHRRLQASETSQKPATSGLTNHSKQPLTSSVPKPRPTLPIPPVTSTAIPTIHDQDALKGKRTPEFTPKNNKRNLDTISEDDPFANSPTPVRRALNMAISPSKLSLPSATAQLVPDRSKKLLFPPKRTIPKPVPIPVPTASKVEDSTQNSSSQAAKRMRLNNESTTRVTCPPITRSSVVYIHMIIDESKKAEITRLVTKSFRANVQQYFDIKVTHVISGTLSQDDYVIKKAAELGIAVISFRGFETICRKVGVLPPASNENQSQPVGQHAEAKGPSNRLTTLMQAEKVFGLPTGNKQIPTSKIPHTKGTTSSGTKAPEVKFQPFKYAYFLVRDATQRHRPIYAHQFKPTLEGGKYDLNLPPWPKLYDFKVSELQEYEVEEVPRKRIRPCPFQPPPDDLDDTEASQQGAGNAESPKPADAEGGDKENDEDVRIKRKPASTLGQAKSTTRVQAEPIDPPQVAPVRQSVIPKPRAMAQELPHKPVHNHHHQPYHIHHGAPKVPEISQASGLNNTTTNSIVPRDPHQPSKQVIDLRKKVCIPRPYATHPQDLKKQDSVKGQVQLNESAGPLGPVKVKPCAPKVSPSEAPADCEKKPENQAFHLRPGHCENCNEKYDVFEQHVSGKRHRAWATDSKNFYELDKFLAGVQRKWRPVTTPAEREGPASTFSTLYDDISSDLVVDDQHMDEVEVTNDECEIETSHVIKPFTQTLDEKDTIELAGKLHGTTTPDQPDDTQIQKVPINILMDDIVSTEPCPSNYDCDMPPVLKDLHDGRAKSDEEPSESPEDAFAVVLGESSQVSEFSSRACLPKSLEPPATPIVPTNPGVLVVCWDLR